MQQLSRRLAQMESIRFLLAGGFNTAFGVADTFLLTRLLLLASPGHAKWMGTASMALSSVINTFVSFLTYKWFVFRSKGNYGREFLRSLTIYLPSMALNTLAVAPLAAVLQRWTGREHESVYLAMGLILSVTILFSFFGHKKVTFRQNAGTAAE